LRALLWGAAFLYGGLLLAVNLLVLLRLGKRLTEGVPRVVSGADLLGLLGLAALDLLAIYLARLAVGWRRGRLLGYHLVRVGTERRVPVTGPPFDALVGLAMLVTLLTVGVVLLVWGQDPPARPVAIILAVLILFMVGDWIRRMGRRRRGEDAVVVRLSDRVVTLPHLGRRLPARALPLDDVVALEEEETPGSLTEDNQPTTEHRPVLVLRSGERVAIGRPGIAVAARTVGGLLAQALAEGGVAVARTDPRGGGAPPGG
jgi:hypothetical protein